jgi:hypothetical protein
MLLPLYIAAAAAAVEYLEQQYNALHSFSGALEHVSHFERISSRAKDC